MQDSTGGLKIQQAQTCLSNARHSRRKPFGFGVECTYPTEWKAMRIEDMLDHVEPEPSEEEKRFAQRVRDCLKALSHAHTQEQRAQALRRTLCPSYIDNPLRKSHAVCEVTMEQQMPPQCVRCKEFIPPGRVANAIKRGKVARFCSAECGAQQYYKQKSAGKKSYTKHAVHDVEATTAQGCARCCTLLARLGGEVTLTPILCKNCDAPIGFHRMLDTMAHGKTPTYCSKGCEWEQGHLINNRRCIERQTKHTCKARGRWGNYDEACARCQELQVAPPSRQALFEQAKREAARI